MRAANLLLEIINEWSYRFNQLALTHPKCGLLVFNVINLVLILFDKFLISFLEDGKGTRLPIINIFLVSVNLGFHKAILHLLKLGSESAEHIIDSLTLLLKSSRGSKYRQLLLLNFKCQLVANCSELFFEVGFISDSFLGFVCEQGKLLGEENDLLRFTEVLGYDVESIFGPS